MSFPDNDTEQTPTADFELGQEFLVDRNAVGGTVLHGQSFGLVALLPGSRGGDVVTRSSRWRIVLERARHGWTVVGRRSPKSKLACAYPRSWPGSYTLRLAPETEYRLAANLISGNWTLRAGRAPLAC